MSHRGGAWRARALLASATLLALAAPAGARGVPAGVVRHDVHVSHTRVVVEGARVLCRVRLFRDDLELVLARQLRRPAFQWSASPAADSLFGAYFAARMAVTADGRRLAARVVASGEDHDPAAGEPMVWYLVELDAPAPVARLGIRNELLFDAFGDQQNIVLLMRPPSERRHSLYFVPGEREEQTVTF